MAPAPIKGGAIWKVLCSAAPAIAGTSPSQSPQANKLSE